MPASIIIPALHDLEPLLPMLAGNAIHRRCSPEHGLGASLNTSGQYDRGDRRQAAQSGCRRGHEWRCASGPDRRAGYDRFCIFRSAAPDGAGLQQTVSMQYRPDAEPRKSILHRPSKSPSYARTHFCQLIGSPATSSKSIRSSAGTISGSFTSTSFLPTRPSLWSRTRLPAAAVFVNLSLLLRAAIV